MTKRRAEIAKTEMERMIGRTIETIRRHRARLSTLRAARIALARLAR